MSGKTLEVGDRVRLVSEPNVVSLRAKLGLSSDGTVAGVVGGDTGSFLVIWDQPMVPVPPGMRAGLTVSEAAHERWGWKYPWGYSAHPGMVKKIDN